jgi:thymidylate kinase
MVDAAGASRGVYVALLGLDGSGKTTVARGLTEQLAEQGFKPKLTQFKDLVAQADRYDYPYLSLRQLLVEIWRTRYAGATDEYSLRVQHGPPLFEDFKRAQLDPGPVYPADAQRSGMVASALLEFVAEMLIQEIVDEHLAGGRIVVRDGFAYRNATKVLRVAGEISPGNVPDDFVDRTLKFVAESCSSSVLQPDLGVFLKVTAEECYRRIMAQRGGVGPFEDMGFAGRSGRSSFMELQGALLAEYERIATSWGWHIVDVSDASPAEALDAVARIVLPGVTSLQRAAHLEI